MQRLCIFLACWCLVLSAGSALGQVAAPARQPVLLDTDLGSDLDDALALGLILASPELDLRCVTTAGSDPNVRALMACRFLTMTGRRHTPVGAGSDPQPKRRIEPTGQYRYYYHPDVLFNRTTRPVKEGAVGLLQSRLKAQPGKATVIAAGPLTNIARLIAEKPESKKWIRRIVVVGGTGAGDAGKDQVNANLAADPAATRAVLNANIPLVIVPGSLTADLTMDAAAAKRIFAPTTALTLQMEALHQLAGAAPANLGDALAVAYCLDEKLLTLEPRAVGVDESGNLTAAVGSPNAQVATKADGARFRRWFVDRIAGCVAPANRPVAPIPPGGFPYRVHVAEDFDTDIERFWWMSGKDETRNLPPGSRRACRGTLTHDYDDLLGHSRAMHTAVIFNPVPGPPMGKRTRLAFRCFLRGSDKLRVQIYSLTNGYHRQVWLHGLPQGKWHTAAVDMTLARRPDGTGGPLSENERIDDIQFYTDPRTELIVDDVILYDAAPEAEKSPFPTRIVFAGTFDTGTQGKHWPGDFELAAEKGFFWRALRSVPQTGSGEPWIRLGLRGERPLGKSTHATFRYRLTGAKSFRVEMLGKKNGLRRTGEVKAAAEGWTRVTVPLTAAAREPETPRADEIRFLLPRGGELLIDDLLLWE